jgi:hypothetical protein
MRINPAPADRGGYARFEPEERKKPTRRFIDRKMEVSAMKRSDDLKAFTLQSYEAFAKGDSAFLERYTAQEDGALAIGSDPGEWWAGYDTIKRVFKAQMQEMGGFVLVDANPQAYSEGTVGWVSDYPKLRLPDGTEIPFRITAVYHKENGAWKMVQWHGSIGVRNEELMAQNLTT